VDSTNAAVYASAEDSTLRPDQELFPLPADVLSPIIFASHPPNVHDAPLSSFLDEPPSKAYESLDSRIQAMLGHTNVEFASPPFEPIALSPPPPPTLDPFIPPPPSHYPSPPDDYEGVELNEPVWTGVSQIPYDECANEGWEDNRPAWTDMERNESSSAREAKNQTGEHYVEVVCDRVLEYAEQTMRLFDNFKHRPGRNSDDNGSGLHDNNIRALMGTRMFSMLYTCRKIKLFCFRIFPFCCPLINYI